MESPKDTEVFVKENEEEMRTSEKVERRKKVKQFSIDYLLNFSPNRISKKPEIMQPLRTTSTENTPTYLSSHLKPVLSMSDDERKAPSPTTPTSIKREHVETIGKIEFHFIS